MSRKVVNPSCVCVCGCGGTTSNAYSRFIKGHDKRKSPVDYIVDEHGCWVWQLARNAHGYGSMRVGPSNLGAHRIYYERVHGPIPDGMLIDHLCRNRACVNPAHMQVVSKRENVRRGVSTRFTTAHRRDMCERYLRGETQSSIAECYGTPQSAVAKIIRQEMGPENMPAHVTRSARGERGKSKLTADAVRRIRRRYAAGGETLSALGAEYSVTPQCIASVVKRETWAHVD